MTVSQILDLLIAALIRKAGGSRRRWRQAIGPVRLYDPATHPHCNWSVAPVGNAQENALIERLLDDVRLDHPLVVKG
ncbi:hypothetical protein LWE61_00185 [Sphingobium sufflavum]|uniref:hypothetical protein n=1 Tax=Sphingobium sufflavum TaxID=1129547 RepID=UPI001F30177F|nr:hypothetical protein [Sphingobium sufflavum]MCE7794965.1 hypothetical protein [Sphingobium sufflavum]